MTKYFVMVGVFETIEVEAVSQEDAELKALDMFDPTAEEPYVHCAWSEDDFNDEALLAENAEREYAAGLENFDPITHIEAQEKTGELK
jgi:hypothetical protein